MLESAIIDSFLRRIKQLAIKGIEIKAKKVHGGGFTSGQPDVLMCYKGHMIQIEFKQPGKKPTDRQREELEDWARAGATTMIATDPITPLINLGLLDESAIKRRGESSRTKRQRARDIPANFDQ